MRRNKDEKKKLARRQVKKYRPIKGAKKMSKTKTKLKLINFKATPEEHAVMKAVAKKYSGGNLGGLIRLLAADRRLLKTNRIRVKRAA